MRGEGRAQMNRTDWNHGIANLGRPKGINSVNWNHVIRFNSRDNFFTTLTESWAAAMTARVGTQSPLSLILDHSPDTYKVVA